jgi:hypothetical protein
MVIKKVEIIYPNLTPNDFVASITEQYKDGGSVTNYIKKTYNNLFEKEGIITTKSEWIDKNGVLRLEYGFDSYRNETGKNLFYYWWDFIDSKMDYEDFKTELKEYFSKRYNKKVDNISALYVGWDRKPKGTYANGGSIKEQNYDMIKSDNQAIMHHTKELDSVLKTNRTIPAWALALVNQSSQNLSKVTHYLEGAKKFATGGVSPQMYGQDVTFLDINGNEQIGMVQEMDENGAELFYEERFMKVPTHRIVKFN